MIDKQLVFATNNQHKLDEIRLILGNEFSIMGLKEAGIIEDIPEDEETLEGNATAKARYVKERYGFDCFADDTGLEIEALEGRPGVKSARYAGPECDAENNIEKVLIELADKEDRRARFRTVIVLIIGDEEHLFEGVVNGRIISERRGKEGFGYDPVFLPDGHDQTFAEMPLELKNRISHRGVATRKLIVFLRHLQSLH